MNIEIGKTAGFCYGVKRAVEGSKEELKDKDKKVYCLGELVHNKPIILELEKKGIEFIQDINEVKDKNAKVIIRAHGIEKEIYEVAKKNNIKLVDYTCPNVLKIHKLVEKYVKERYYIFLTGVENHPEVIGIRSNCGKEYSLITDEEDIEKAMIEFKNTHIKKLLLISQTTYSIKKFENIEKKIKNKIEKDIELVVKNTICLSTELRQKETKELSKKVDMMIIIGGKNSSNTKKIYEVALENCKKAICIETQTELEKVDFSNIEYIGIMAGASTPQESINEVVKFLEK